MVLKDGSKMSKSKGNTVDPQSYIEKYGADTVRLYMMFTSPPEQSLEWSESSVEGASRFLKRIWSLIEGKKYIKLDMKFEFSKKEIELRRKCHSTLKKVENDYESRFSFNTAIAAIMELLNFIPDEFKKDNASDAQKFCLNEAILFSLKMLFPISPHICEYLWTSFVNDGSCIESSWPKYDEAIIESDEFELIIQVNGKVRGKLNISKNLDEETVKNLSLEVENVKNIIADSEIKKAIFVKDKLINFVI